MEPSAHAVGIGIGGGNGEPKGKMYIRGHVMRSNCLERHGFVRLAKANLPDPLGFDVG